MMIVEPATIEEIPAIKKVLSETWTATYGGFLSADAVKTVTSIWHAPERLAAQVRSPEVFLGVVRAEHGQIAGMITVRQLDDATVSVDRLYVRPGEQRRGMGGALLKAGLAAFAKARYARLEVEERNTLGLGFWHKQGFREIGRRTEHVAGVTLRNVEMEKLLV
jgi:ribosomal protein S18 acetylase RimI-like enzyme